MSASTSSDARATTRPAAVVNEPSPVRKIAVIPIYNEESTLCAILDEVVLSVDAVVIVEDGSSDRSLDRIREWVAGRSNVALIRHARNRGMAQALKSGFLYMRRCISQGIFDPRDIIINLDADGQHPLEEIGPIVRKMQEEDLDLLLVSRDFSLYPLYKVLGNRFLSFLARFVTAFPYRDVESGFRFFRARDLQTIMEYYSGWKYSCAQEIAIITALHNLRICNTYRIRINYYRPGTTFADGFAVLIMSIISWLRVKLRWKNDPRRLEARLREAIIEKNLEGMPNA